jgi:hypothetical protein
MSTMFRDTADMLKESLEGHLDRVVARPPFAKVNLKCFKREQLKLMNEALEILKPKNTGLKLQEAEGRVAIVKLVERADTIFNIDLKIKLIEEETDKLRQLSAQKAQEVTHAHALKELEYVRYRENFERRKRTAEQTMEKCTSLTAKKLNLVKEIKNKAQIQGILKNENKKLEDLANYFSELKHFLDEISPDFFKEKKIADLWTN